MSFIYEFIYLCVFIFVYLLKYSEIPVYEQFRESSLLKVLIFHIDWGVSRFWTLPTLSPNSFYLFAYEYPRLSY